MVAGDQPHLATRLLGSGPRAYGGWASGEGQGEFTGDGYSAQGQFSNQRVAQYGDQGYDQDYGRQGIGWQNRHHEQITCSGRELAGSRTVEEREFRARARVTGGEQLGRSVLGRIQGPGW